MPRQKSKRRKRRSKKRSKSRRKSKKRSKKRSKSKSARSLKQLKTRAKRSKKRGDQERCEYGRAVNDRCLENRGKLSQGMATKYRYNKAPLQGKLLRVQQSDAGPLVYTNLNSKESIVIPMSPEELEKYFGSSKEGRALQAQLSAQKRNLRLKYNQLEKVHKKLENIKREKEKRKEPVHPNCEMLMSMISSNLKLANQKLVELDNECKALDKSHQALKKQEDDNKNAASKLRKEMRELSQGKKVIESQLSASKRQKSRVKSMLKNIIKMSNKVSQTCNQPLVSKMRNLPELKSPADLDAQKAADKVQVPVQIDDAQKVADKGQVPVQIDDAQKVADSKTSLQKQYYDKLDNLLDAPDKMLFEQEIEDDTFLSVIDKKYGFNDDFYDTLEDLNNVTPEVMKRIDAFEKDINNLIQNLTILEKQDNSDQHADLENKINNLSREQEKVYDALYDKEWMKNEKNVEYLLQKKRSQKELLEYKRKLYSKLLRQAKKVAPKPEPEPESTVEKMTVPPSLPAPPSAEAKQELIAKEASEESQAAIAKEGFPTEAAFGMHNGHN